MNPGILERIDAMLADDGEPMPSARREVLELIRHDPERVIDEGFEALAARSGCSVPTIMRTCRDLGFAGLREFRLALVQELAVGGSPLHRRVQLEDSTEQVLAKVTKSAAAAVNSVQAQLDPRALEAAATAIAQASRVDCYCVGATSGFMASDFQARLFRMGLSSNAYLDQHLQLVSAATLDGRGVAYGPVRLGAMIEVPAAALLARRFLHYFDYLSIGTNDLIQYALAIDRADESVAHLYDPLHPAVLRLVADVIAAGAELGKSVSVCGEVAGDVAMTRLLLGLGLRSFSMHPAQILAVKQELLRADTRKLVPWAQQVLESDDPAQAMEALAMAQEKSASSY